MADQAGARKDISNQPGLEEPTGADLSASPRADRVSALREKIIVPKSGGFKKETDESASILAETRRLSETLFGDTPRPGQAPEESEEPILLLKPVNAAPVFSASGKTMKIIYPMAALVSGLWLGFCIFHLLRGGLPADPQTLGTLLAGMFAPPAMLWMALGTFSRRAEMNLHASALRAELHSILFPSPENAQRINRDVERLCAQAAEISTNSRAVLKSLHRARQGLHTEIREFSSLSKKAEFSIDRLAQSLTDRAENLLSLTEEIEQRTAHIDEKARAGAEAWDRATLSVLDRAGEMESAMGRGADKILKAADKAGSEMKQAEQALEEAEKRMGAALSVRSAAVSEVSAVLSADLEKMDSTLNGQIEKLAAGALETSQRLNLLKDALAQTALAAEPLYTRLSEKAHGAKTDIQAVRAALEEVESTQMPILERMGSALGDQVRILKDSVENADRVLSQSGTQVQGLAQTALEAASQIRNAGDIFADRTQELQDYMVESLNMAEAYHGELKTRIEELSEKAVKSATRMDQAVSSLGGHMETIGKTAAAATVKVERAQEKMGLESERLLSVSTASLEAARESALSFARHSETLARASRDALEAADELDNAATGRRRQAFMESAKFMIESLHSLSVDLDRAIEGGVSQKAWKQFQKGDVSAFTGRLAELIGGVSLKRAQEQFTRNPEFRTYALRFLDQFEDLCAQAGRSDPSLLLESTIASGDLGKLYRFLSSAAGRAIA